MARIRALFFLVGLVASGASAACAPPFAKSPEFTDCAQLQPLHSVPVAPVDSDPIVIRGRAQLSSDFALRGICMRVDGRRAYLRTLERPAAIQAFFEVPIALHGAEPHHVSVVALYEGTGDLSGYKFQIVSHHDVTSDERSAGGLLMRLIERGDESTSIERRPTIEWAAAPNARPPEPEARDAGQPPDGEAPRSDENAGT